MYEWLILSVSPSVTHFWLCSHHCIIMKFLGVITNDQSELHAKGQCQRSKVKVTEVKTPLNCFRTVTPVLIYIWWWKDAQSLMLLRRGVLLFFRGHPSNFEVTQLKKNRRFSGLQLQFEFTNGYEMMHKAKRCRIVFQSHPSNFKAGDKIDATLWWLEKLYS